MTSECPQQAFPCFSGLSVLSSSLIHQCQCDGCATSRPHTAVPRHRSIEEPIGAGESCAMDRSNAGAHSSEGKTHGLFPPAHSSCSSRSLHSTLTLSPWLLCLQALLQAVNVQLKHLTGWDQSQANCSNERRQTSRRCNGKWTG